MSDQEQVQWTGKSGNRYTYYSYNLPANINRGQNGNYIYTCIVNRSWKPLYIGQGDLGDRTDINQHHQSYCLKNKGATHVHAHKNEGAAARLAEEKDLLSNYPQAYKPSGCNEQAGG